MGRPTRVAIQRDVPFEASSREVLCRPAQDPSYDVDVSASQFVSILDAGNAVYEPNWSGCHGVDGRSRPVAAAKDRNNSVPGSRMEKAHDRLGHDGYGSPCHPAAVPMQQVGPQQLF
jgi:hypothetical protein